MDRVIPVLDEQNRWWGSCPKCKTLHRLDENQAKGEVSIICTNCDYRTPVYHRDDDGSSRLIRLDID